MSERVDMLDGKGIEAIKAVYTQSVALYRALSDVPPVWLQINDGHRFLPELVYLIESTFEAVRYEPAWRLMSGSNPDDLPSDEVLRQMAHDLFTGVDICEKYADILPLITEYDAATYCPDFLSEYKGDNPEWFLTVALE